jgi:hypothetical protein
MSHCVEPKLLSTQNKPESYMCVSCAWAKPSKTHPPEFCKNGPKATAWEVTSRRADRVFFDECRFAFNQGLPHFNLIGIIRALRSSCPALPYIARGQRSARSKNARTMHACLRIHMLQH